MQVMGKPDQELVTKAMKMARARDNMLFTEITTKEEQKRPVSSLLRKEADYIKKVVVALDNLDGFNWQHSSHVY